MKKLSINTKDGIKTIKCFEFDGLYESFKTIWNAIHNQMALIALRYKEKKYKFELACDFTEESSRFYVQATNIFDMWLCQDVDSAWEKALYIDGWSKEAINKHDKIEDFCIDNLLVLTEDIIDKTIILKQLSINNNRAGSYLLIDPDNVIDGLYISEIDFIDDFFLSEGDM